MIPRHPHHISRQALVGARTRGKIRRIDEGFCGGFYFEFETRFYFCFRSSLTKWTSQSITLESTGM